jgi:hypothetical protein
VWGGWLSKKLFQKELAMHRLIFDPGQCRVLLLVQNKIENESNGPYPVKSFFIVFVLSAVLPSFNLG